MFAVDPNQHLRHLAKPERFIHVITDIGLRMLQPRELYRAQGFPDDYLIEQGHDGRKFSKSNQVRFCGNSVSPPPAEALIRANYVDAGQAQQARVA